jgi:RHS repeat-associated protein
MTGPLSGNAGPTFRAAVPWWCRAADRFRNQLTTDGASEYEQGAPATFERQDLPQLRQRDPRLRRTQVRGGTSLVPVLDMTLLLENGHVVIEAIPTASTRLRPILPAFPPRVDTGYQLGQTACVLENYVAEADATNTVNVVYTNEPQGYGNLVSTRISTTTAYHHFDAIGSTRQLTNSSGTTTDTVIYDAWGIVAQRSGSTSLGLLWIGQVGYYSDVERTLCYVRRRIYLPAIGRWASEDPLYEILLAADVNPYRYVGNRPAMEVDPPGLQVRSDTKHFGPAPDRDYLKVKRCIFTTDSSNPLDRARWDSDAQRLYDESAGGSVVFFGMRNPEIMPAMIMKSGCCEVVIIGHRGGLNNAGIVTGAQGEERKVFPNDALADAIGRAIARNSCKKCSIRIFACQLCQATVAQCIVEHVEPGLREEQGKMEAANWRDLARRTKCTVVTPVEIIAVSGPALNLGTPNRPFIVIPAVTCVPGGCQAPHPIFGDTMIDLAPPRTRSFPPP